MTQMESTTATHYLNRYRKGWMKSDTLHDKSHGEAREGGSRPEHNKGYTQQALVNMTVRRAKLKLWPRSVTRQGCPLSTPVQYRARSLGESNETRWNKKDTHKKTLSMYS